MGEFERIGRMRWQNTAIQELVFTSVIEALSLEEMLKDSHAFSGWFRTTIYRFYSTRGL
jgi:hypothetical protein